MEDHRHPTERELLILILQRLNLLLRMENLEMLDLSTLNDAVGREISIGQSAIVLMNQIADALRATDGDQTAVNALADQLVSSADDIGAAIEANTPAAPEPAPAEPPLAGDAPPVEEPTP